MSSQRWYANLLQACRRSYCMIALKKNPLLLKHAVIEEECGLLAVFTLQVVQDVYFRGILQSNMRHQSCVVHQNYHPQYVSLLPLITTVVRLHPPELHTLHYCQFSLKHLTRKGTKKIAISKEIYPCTLFYSSCDNAAALANQQMENNGF